MNQRATPIERIAALLLIGAWCAMLAPLMATAASDVRVLGAFDTDEVLHVNLLQDVLRQRTFALRFGSYPHLYYNIALVSLRMAAAVRPVGVEQIVVVLRTISVASGAAMLWLLFVWTFREYGRWAAWLVLAATAVNGMIFGRTIYAHPDLLQQFFIEAALFATALYYDDPARKRLLLAASLAGLAFASKYGGGIVLGLLWLLVLLRSSAREPAPWPSRAFRIATAAIGALLLLSTWWLDVPHVAALVTEDGLIDVPSPDLIVGLARWTAGLAGVALVAAAAWRGVWTALDRQPRARHVLRQGVESTAAFAAAFAIASPFSFARFQVVKGLAYHVVHEGLETQTATAAWGAMMAGSLGFAIAVAGAGVALWLLLAIVRGRPHSGTDVVLVLWVSIFAIVLFLPTHGVAGHYLLPVIPSMIMLAARGLGSIARLSGARLSVTGQRLAAAAVGAGVLLVLWPLSVRLAAGRRDALGREGASLVLRAGEWLACHVPATARIAHDQGAYVPATFAKATPMWEGSISWLKSTDPDVVIVDHDMTDSLRRTRAIADYYECVESGACGFSRVHRLGGIDTYVRLDRVRVAQTGIGRCD